MSDWIRPTLVAASLFLATPAGAQTLGDFGRPAYPYDASPPPKAAGAHFNLTDEESEMHNRIWRFLMAPHAAGWFDFQRLEVARAGYRRGRKAGDIGTYYRHVQRRDFRSSRVRYGFVADDARADLDTLPTTFEAICVVREVDRRRRVALEGIAGADAPVARQVLVRHQQNEHAMAVFSAALSFRYESYALALDQLLIETPHEEAMPLDGLLSDLATWVEAAERGDFCDFGLDAGDVVVIAPRELISK